MGKDEKDANMSMTLYGMTWFGIGLCVLHSAMFSGLNLALFGLSRLRLEIEVATDNPAAAKLLALRQDSNFLLTTILWGNVGTNVLLTLLSNSILAGVSAFIFSTVVITFIGEIAPQAYFSRHALRMGTLLSPLLKFYQCLLYPVAKPTALALDWWLGTEGIQYFRERGLREMIRKHIDADETDIDRLEGVGALNFLALDDLGVVQEGERIDPDSIISLPITGLRPCFPPFERSASDRFLQRINASGKKWVVITDLAGEPRVALDADAFLREVWFSEALPQPELFCHRPIVVRDTTMRLGRVLGPLRFSPQGARQDVIDQDLILVWGDTRRIITGADILGYLLRGAIFS
jgi:metal transporter CNNM